MPYDFPASPTNGQIFNSGGPIYTYLNGLWLSGAGAVPVITSSGTQTTPENAAFSMTLSANKTVIWSKVGGADASLFTLSGSTLSMTAKNYEAPADANADNVYVVQVSATDALGNVAVQTINCTVTDVAEGGAQFAVTDTISDSADLVSGFTRTYSAKAIGSAASDRIVLFCLQYQQVMTGRAVPFVTCNGTEMMLCAMSDRASNMAPTQIYAAKVPTGTTADFVITFNTPDANANISRLNAFICAVTNCSMIPAGMLGDSDTTLNSATALTLDLDTKVEVNGLLVCLGGGDLASGAAPANELWTGATKDQTLVTESLRTTIAHYLVGANETARDISYVVGGGGVNVSGPTACAISFAALSSTKKFAWDTFERADSVLGSSLVPTGLTTAGNWVWDARTPEINIVSGRLTNNNTNGPGTVYSFDVSSADQWVEWVVDNTSASNGPFSALRVIDYDNFIGCRVSGTNIEVFRREASGMNSLLSTNYDASFGVLFRLEAIGTSLRVMRNGEVKNTFTIAAPFLTPTKIGLVGRSSVLANFLGRWRGGAI